MGVLSINGGRIWENGALHRNENFKVKLQNGAIHRIDLDESDMILPGLVDFHAHLFSPAAQDPFGVATEKYYAEGIFAAMDAGTYGYNDWEESDLFWKNGCDMQIRSFINILPEGLSRYPVSNPTKPQDISFEKLRRLLSDNERLLGVKIQLGWLPYKNYETDMDLLRLARKVADDTGKKVMVHISDSYASLSEIVAMLRAGDIITHIYAGFRNAAWTEEKGTEPAVIKAKEKGIIFDVGHAQKHFSWDVFRNLWADGIRFDTLGADITDMSYHRETPFSIYDYYNMLSGFLGFGLDMETILKGSIDRPLEILGLSQDLEKRLSIVRFEKKNFQVCDGLGKAQNCSSRCRPMLCVSKGNVILNRLII